MTSHAQWIPPRNLIVFVHPTIRECHTLRASPSVCLDHRVALPGFEDLLFGS